MTCWPPTSGSPPERQQPGAGPAGTAGPARARASGPHGHPPGPGRRRDPSPRTPMSRDRAPAGAARPDSQLDRRSRRPDRPGSPGRTGSIRWAPSRPASPPGHRAAPRRQPSRARCSCPLTSPISPAASCTSSSCAGCCPSAAATTIPVRYRSPWWLAPAAWARPRSRCTPRTGCDRSTRTASALRGPARRRSLSRCPQSMSWPGSCATSGCARLRSRPARRSGPRCTGRGSTARRTLSLLDNAHDAAQVRPLLPGSASCAVIVTSRSRLSDLVGGGLVHLDVLDDSEALALFSRIVGTDRAAAEPDATAELLVACAGLPLAIRICAARLAARDRWTIRWLADRISDEHRRLDEMKVGDLAVRASFEVSFSSLPGAGRVMCPGARFPACLACGRAVHRAGRGGCPDRPAGRQGRGRAGAPRGRHLLESPARDCYRFHDLLRVYAAERADGGRAGCGTNRRGAPAARLVPAYGGRRGAALAPYRYRRLTPRARGPAAVVQHR